LRVDCNGIYHEGQLVTNWDNFVEAFIWQDPYTDSGQDDCVLILRYYKEGIEGTYRMRIALTDTQDKHEGELLEAIARFYRLSREAVIDIWQPLQLGQSNE
jgi:hypothetical protein